MELGSIPRLMHALKWSMGAEIASKAIQPLIFVVLARLLSPEDFGVMAAALMVISFSQVFWESGMGKAVIQWQGDTDVASNVAFWINLVLGLAVTAILFFSAARIAELFFHDDRVAGVLQVMTLQVLLGSVASIHVALLQKDMQFKRLFWVRFATVSLPGLVSIPLAWNGMGYWALVAGALLGQATQTLVLWRISMWRPWFGFDRVVAVDLARFGIWVGFSGLLVWFYIWADSLVVGMYLGANDLGLYRTGNQFVMMIFGLMFAPILPVLYSHLSVIQADRVRLRKMLLKVMRIITVLAVPLAFLLFALAEPLSSLVFGEQWDGIGLVIGVMALMHGFSWVVGANGEVYRAMGKPAYETIVTAGILVVYLVGYVISAQQGFEIFVWTRYALAMGAVFLHIYVAYRVIQIPVMALMISILSISLVSLTPVVIKEIILGFDVSDLGMIVIVTAISIPVVAVSLLFIERDGLLRDFRALLKGKVAS